MIDRGMSADEIETMLSGVDWDTMFGSSNFEFKKVTTGTLPFTRALNW
jgi:hypothetical protein